MRVKAMRSYDPDRHHRRSIRLRGHDYATPRAYFITICVQDRRCVFGAVRGGRLTLSAVEHDDLRLSQE